MPSSAAQPAGFELALRYLARREYTCLMLQKKLLENGCTASCVDTSLRRLLECGLLSDRRFCEALIAKRLRQGYGPQRISAELKQQGVDKAMIVLQLQPYEHQWLEYVQQIQQKKFGTQPNTTEQKRRQIRFLHYRGFTHEQINACFDASLAE